MKLKKPLIYGSVITVLILVGVAGGLATELNGKIFPGVTVNSMDLSGKSKDEASALLRNYLRAYSDQRIILINGNNKTSVTQDELGFQFDEVKSVENAYSVGRNGTLKERLKITAITRIRGNTLTPAYTLDSEKLNAFVENLANGSANLGSGSHYILNDQNQLVSVVGKEGDEIDTTDLKKILLANLQNLNFSDIWVPLKPNVIVLSEQELNFLKPQAQGIIEKKITLTYLNRKYELTPLDKLNLLNPTKSVDGILQIDFNSENLQNLLSKIGKEVNVEAQDGVLEITKGKVTKFIPPRDGTQIDEPKSAELIVSAMKEANIGVVELPIIESIANPLPPNELGILELVGEGHTQFLGSAPGRIHNIGLAASRVSGTLIPPGGVFSFNQSVGEITAKTGYDQAYIIQDRKTQLGTGGGVCQVSTTVYRAALKTGLEILERRPHAYRVGYYEPAGLDATVYGPYLDLKFRNNMEKHILIWSYFDPYNSTLTFQMYGTNDGRIVDLSNPMIRSGAPAPEPIYQEDSSLEPGVKKQVDFAVNGATALVTRKVTKQGKVLIDEKIASSYSPWQSVFLVGPED